MLFPITPPPLYIRHRIKILRCIAWKPRKDVDNCISTQSARFSHRVRPSRLFRQGCESDQIRIRPLPSRSLDPKKCIRVQNPDPQLCQGKCRGEITVNKERICYSGMISLGLGRVLTPPLCTLLGTNPSPVYPTERKGTNPSPVYATERKCTNPSPVYATGY